MLPTIGGSWESSHEVAEGGAHSQRAHITGRRQYLPAMVIGKTSWNMDAS